MYTPPAMQSPELGTQMEALLASPQQLQGQVTIVQKLEASPLLEEQCGQLHGSWMPLYEEVAALADQQMEEPPDVKDQAKAPLQL